MSAALAARLGDEIAHSSALGMLVAGVVAGAVAAVAVVAIVGTGGVAAVAIGAGIAAAGAGGGLAGLSIGEAMAPTVTGKITTGSPDVFIEGPPAARAGLDTTLCRGIISLHSPHGLIAQGSDGVFINNMMAARKGDKIVCGAKISSACKMTFIGGGPATAAGLEIADEVPPWLVTTLKVVMWGGAIIATGGAALVVGPWVAGGAFVGSMLGGAGLGWLGGKAGRAIGEEFGNPELGERIGEAVGGFVGAILGGMGGGKLGGLASPGTPITPEDGPSVGIEEPHLDNMQEQVQSGDPDILIVREPNPDSLQYHPDADGNPLPTPEGGVYKPKPMSVKAKTAKSGPYKGMVVNEDGTPYVDADNNRYYSDYDLQGAYKKNPDGSVESVDTNDPEFQKRFNENVSPEEDMVQHGANDNCPEPGRQPGGEEVYVVVQNDGTILKIQGTGQLQNYYKQQGIPWPYDNYNKPPTTIVVPSKKDTDK
jgi:uncharacterized Zn-binding protein involved in type VI secretion